MSEPTLICVLGMPGSGTSLVAQALDALGLDLGKNEPITELNDAILEWRGGSWLKPPELPPDWERSSKLNNLRRGARELIQSQLSGSDQIGFADPRFSLTLPFWQRILPPMRYVTCLRNPVDVAFSLADEHEEGLPFDEGVQLWLTYARSALGATAIHPVHTIFHEDLTLDPEPEVRRLASFIGIEDADIGEAIRVLRSRGSTPHRTAAPNVVDEPRLPFHIKALYLALRLFAPGAETVGVETLNLFGTQAVDSERRRADVERRLGESGADLDRLAQERADENRDHHEREARAKSVHAQLRAELTVTRTELRAARDQIKQLQEGRPDLAAGTQNPLARDSIRGAYDELIDEVRARAQEVIPVGATVLVVSKGDDQLVRLEGRDAWHFPLAPGGTPAGYHPSGDTAVIAQLEAMRATGAEYLLLPATTLWWLDHYHGLRRHLDDRYVALLRDEHCAIYRLGGADTQRSSGPLAAVKQAVASLRTGSGREPAVLDWHTRLEIADQLPETPVFAPPEPGGILPYVDRSIDIVVLSFGDEGRLAEARRVSSGALVRVDPGFPDVAEVQWLSDGSGRWGENVNVTLLPDGDEPAWEATVRAFAETLDGGFAGRLNIVGSRAALAPLISAQTAAGARCEVRLMEVDAQDSFAQRARAAAESIESAYHVFVAAPAVPLPNWLPSILVLFSRTADAGVIGTRILSRFGALEEAGGVLAADGSQRRRGEGDEDPDRSEYRFVKQVDFCSAPVLATRREVFERLGGFGNRNVGPADPIIDFSLRASREGASVYYQPQARMVKIGGSDG